jgi:uncharacterized membrane protein (DUF441 family)
MANTTDITCRIVTVEKVLPLWASTTLAIGITVIAIAVIFLAVWVIRSNAEAEKQFQESRKR